MVEAHFYHLGTKSSPRKYIYNIQSAYTLSRVYRSSHALFYRQVFCQERKDSNFLSAADTHQNKNFVVVIFFIYSNISNFILVVVYFTLTALLSWKKSWLFADSSCPLFCCFFCSFLSLGLSLYVGHLLVVLLLPSCWSFDWKLSLSMFFNSSPSFM